MVVSAMWLLKNQDDKFEDKVAFQFKWDLLVWTLFIGFFFFFSFFFVITVIKMLIFECPVLDLKLSMDFVVNLCCAL